MGALQPEPENGAGIMTRGIAGAATACCGVHCALAPLLAGAIPFFALPEAAEWGMAGFATLACGARLFSDRACRAPWMVLGLGVWYASLAGLLAPLPIEAGNAAGAFIVAGAIFFRRPTHGV